MRGVNQQLYILTQLALREYVGKQTLDELMEHKDQLHLEVQKRLADQAKDLGVQLNYVGIKDIILPGEIREILNMVLVAEKKARANIITRREETASTRSLLNTARLMDENPTLYRLKELEYMERLADRVGSINLNGTEGLMQGLTAMLQSARAGPEA